MDIKKAKISQKICLEEKGDAQVWERKEVRMLFLIVGLGGGVQPGSSNATAGRGQKRAVMSKEFGVMVIQVLYTQGEGLVCTSSVQM